MNWLAWSLISALFAAATAILSKIGVSNLDSNLATAIRTSVVLVLAWGIVFVTAAEPVTTMVQQIGRKTLLFLILSGVATALSWLCYFRAMQLGEASRVGPVDKLSVVFVVILAAIFLGEKMSPVGIAGVALIAVGAILVAIQ